MTTRREGIDRRAFLGAGAAFALTLAGCSTSGSRAASGSASAPSHGGGQPGKTISGATAGLRSLEQQTGRRIGVQIVDMSEGTVFGFRSNERFPMCSTYKTLCVAAVLAYNSDADLRQTIHYTHADLVEYSPVTSHHVGEGLTLDQLCAAAVRFSDNTAANLLLTRVGGPKTVTAFLRHLGDPVTRLDRNEPGVNTAIPGDPRDTTTPHAIATDYLRLTTTDVIGVGDRAKLTGWLKTNTTGAGQIRASVPRGWLVGDKTGSGDFGATNDVAILYPPARAPIALSVLTTSDNRRALPAPALIAKVTAQVEPVLPQ